MKIRTFCLPAFMLFSVLFFQCVHGQAPNRLPATLAEKDPWSARDLLAPETLAAALKSGEAKDLKILNIGVVEDIAGAQHIGAASKPEQVARLKKTVSPWPKSTKIVLYCGCCPFAKCPNIRPAFRALKAEGFTAVKLLDLPVNLQTDWIKKGYPLRKP